MKKIGLWMAALTAVTVGGVYASFYYSQDIAGINEDKNRSIQVTGTANSGVAGKIAIDTTKLIAQIDSVEQYKKDITDNTKTYLDEIYQGYGELSNHVALLDITGYITITFTPDSNAEQDVFNHGIETNVSFSVNGSMSDWSYMYEGTQYNILESEINTDAFSFTIYPEGTVGKGDTTWEKQTDGTLTYTIEAASIYNGDKQLIKVKPIDLNTIEHHTAYKGALTGKEITVTVTTAGANPTPDSGSADDSGAEV